jgi:hypothetical protein
LYPHSLSGTNGTWIKETMLALAHYNSMEKLMTEKLDEERETHRGTEAFAVINVRELHVVE